MNLNTIMLISLLLWAPGLWANQETPPPAKRLIKEILEQPEFQTTKEIHYWRYLGGSSPDKTASSLSSKDKMIIFSQIAQSLEWVLWIFVGIGTLFFIFRIRNHLGSFSLLIPSPSASSPRVFTTNLPIKESLPPHLAQHAWELWQMGEVRTAISLLYRGTLIFLSTPPKGQSIQESATERECLHWVKHQHPNFHDYFFRLTTIWQSVAYAQRLPSPEEVQQLCNEWAQYFEE